MNIRVTTYCLTLTLTYILPAAAFGEGNETACRTTLEVRNCSDAALSVVVC